MLRSDSALMPSVAFGFLLQRMVNIPGVCFPLIAF